MSTDSNADKKRAARKEVAKGVGVVALLIVLMMWLAGTFVKKVEPGPPAPKPQPPKVSTQKVERQVYLLTIDQVGTVRAQTEARVSSRVMAQVKEILVKEGDPVSGGNDKSSPPTILALLQDADIKARLNQAEALPTIGATWISNAVRRRRGNRWSRRGPRKIPLKPGWRRPSRMPGRQRAISSAFRPSKSRPRPRLPKRASCLAIP